MATAYIPPTSTERPDDYEQWYTEPTPNNRMVLAARSGITAEITWAMDRICRASDHPQFIARNIPGILDALFEWPEWYIQQVQKPKKSELEQLFAPPDEEETKRRHALHSIFALRNLSVNPPNAVDLAARDRTRRLVFSALHYLDANDSHDAEFLLDAMDMFKNVMNSSTLPPVSFPPGQNPIHALEKIVHNSCDRTLIISAFHVLASMLNNTANAHHLRSSSSALATCLRCLPVISYSDKELTEACLTYLYAHLSHPPMAKAFLIHPGLPSTLRLLVCVLLSEQAQETAYLEVGEPPEAPSAIPSKTSPYVEVTKEELDALAILPEPQRYSEWMQKIFILTSTGEIEQKDLYKLYEDTFGPYRDQFPLLPAPDVIHGLPQVFPNAHSVVIPGPPPKFVVRGIERKREVRPLCRWDRGQCGAPFDTPGELATHIRTHVDAAADTDAMECLWGTCAREPLAPNALRAHVATHVLGALPPDVQALSGARIVHGVVPPPTGVKPARTTVAYPRAVGDPASAALTALLCIRLLFHASFVSSEAAPRADANHFGFPGVLDDDEVEEGTPGVGTDADADEGERRGRRAFVGVRHLLERVLMKDEVLMGWVNEMVDAATYGML